MIPILSIIAVAAFGLSHFLLKHRRHVAVNIGEGTHDEALSRVADATFTDRHLLVKAGTTPATSMALCGASDIPLGTCPDEPASGDLASILLLGKGSTKKMVASEQLSTIGVPVYTAANGKIQDLPAGAGTYYQVGYLLTTAAADGDEVEVLDHAPIKTVVSAG